MFTAMMSRPRLLLVLLGLMLALGVGWAAFKVGRDQFADKSNAPGAPASEQAAARGRPDGSTTAPPAAPGQAVSGADRTAEASGSGPAAAQQRQPATQPAARVDAPAAPSTSPELAARDQAPPPREAVTAPRALAPVEPPAGQPHRQVEALTPPGKPQGPAPDAAPAASPAVPPPPPAAAGVSDPAAEQQTAVAVPAEVPAASKPLGAAPAPPRAAPAPEAAKRPEPQAAPAPPDARAAVALAEPKSAQPEAQPGPAEPSIEPAPADPAVEPAPRPSGDARPPSDQAALQETARAPDQERRDELRSAPARATDTIRRAITSLFGGATDAPTPPEPKQAQKTTETEVAAVPDPGDARERGSAPADVDPGAAPTFDIVRIEPRGQSVMAGRAAPGAEVEIRSGDRLIDRTRADQRGEWVVVPAEPLARGVQELRLSARVQDRPAIESAEVLVVAIPDPPPPEPALRLPDDVLPKVVAAAPADQAFAVAVPREGTGKGRILQAPGRISGEGALALVMLDYDDAGRIRLSGEGSAGAPLRIYVNNQPAGVAMVGSSGRWDAVLERTLMPGDYTLRVDQLGASGRPDARLETPFTRVDHPPVAGEVAVDYVIVQPGNSLWRIARRVFGEGLRYMHIYEANEAQIRDPDLIYPGQVFEIPSGIGTSG